VPNWGVKTVKQMCKMLLHCYYHWITLCSQLTDTILCTCTFQLCYILKSYLGKPVTALTLH